MAAKKTSKKSAKKSVKKATRSSAPKLARKPAKKPAPKKKAVARRRAAPKTAAVDTQDLLGQLARQTGLPADEVLARALASFAAAQGLSQPAAAPAAPVKQTPVEPPAPAADTETYPDDSHIPALGPDVRLYIHPPGRAPQEMIKDTFFIGSSNKCDLWLNYPTVETRHARIVREGRSYFVEDLQTTKGTVVHGEKITRYELKHEDDIFVAGYVKVRFYLLN